MSYHSSRWYETFPFQAAAAGAYPSASRSTHVVCSGSKIRFPDRLAAEAALLVASFRRLPLRRAYHCAGCDGWHLTRSAE